VALAVAIFGLPNSLSAASVGETFTCHFGPYRQVIINTREPDPTVTVDGRRHAASSGSYFYQSEDGKIAVMFGPDMKW
jgi:hypothetical protein